MKIVGPVLTAAAAYLVGLTSAAPAIVWKNNGSSSSRTSHISNAMDARSLLSSVGITGNTDDNDASSSSLSAVIFLVGRNTDGSEGLSSLLSSNNGMMAGVKDRYLMADEIYYHVHGVESARTMARDVRHSSSSSVEGKEGGKVTVAEVTMEEFQRKLASLAQSEIEEAEVAEIGTSVESSSKKKITKAQQKRRKAISEADVLVVSVANKSNEEDDATAKQLDATIVAAIDSSAIRNVVLSSIRSTDEVKHARKLAVVERLTKNWSSTSSSSRRRRLEDAAAAAGDENVNNNNAQSESEAGIYYVNMTPNIFAGLLFFFMFVMTAHIGLTCMNMIEGQDVYVKKMPHIGREV
ncbi:hypothetical protein ACHAWU_006842 [Discostella pseudostelligera]|uniref:Uncharacterized protein n=1 Tax=Discostella pseudostelligera TaxID=259834 RepID=A0ABD3N3F9_9STRA